jgi:hypothetical protein
MKSNLSALAKRGAAAAMALLLSGSAMAFPPAPHHTLYGMVRNQFGEPLNIFPADVYLETPGGFQLHAGVINNLEPGINYRLEVPMDSGSSSESNAYQPTALKPFFQFRLKVLIGQTVYLPIQMSGSFAQIGLPGQKTRLDLTLGVDSDGDGLPDEWEQSLISIYGGTLASIRPQDDADGDGISNLSEYLAGTYAFDPSDGFRLAVMSAPAGASDLEFLAIRGRTYSIQSSPNLQQWAPVNFGVLTGDVAGSLQANFQAADVRTLRVRVPYQPGATNRFFRALVQ